MHFQTVRFFQTYVIRCLLLAVMLLAPALSWAAAYTGTLTCAASNYTLDVPALGVSNVTSTGQAGFGISPTLNTMNVGDTLTISTTGCTYTSSLTKTFWTASFSNNELVITATGSSYNAGLNSSSFSFNIGLSSMPPPGDYLRITFSGFTAGDPTPTLTFATPTSASVALGSTLSNVATSSVTAAGAGSITYSSSDTSVATVNSSGVVTPVAVGSATITATQAAVSGTNAQATQTYTVNVTLAQQAAFSLTAPTSLIRLSGGFTLGNSGGSGSGAVTYVLTSGASSCTLNGVTVFATGTVGTCRITATKAASGIYDAATAYADISVVAEPTPTLTFSTPTSATITLLGSLTNTVTSTAVGSSTFPVGAITYSSSNTAVATVNSANGQITPIAVGTTMITASQARADGANSAATQTYTLTVTLVPQATLTVTASNTSLVQGGSTATLSTTGGTSDGAVTYAITSGQSSCTLSGNTVTSTSTLGTCTITATKAAHAVYAAATATVNIGVGNAPTPTLTFATPNSLAVTMGMSPMNAASSSITGAGAGAISYASSNTSIATVNSSTGQITPVAVGTVTITATQAAGAGVNMQATQTYTLTVSLATQATLTASASPTSILPSTGTSTLTTTGGSGTGAVTYAVTSGASSCTLNGNTVTATSTVGTCTITATKAAQGNYDAATATVTINVANLIAQATLTATASPSAISKNTGVSTLSTSGGSGTGAVSYALTTNSTNSCTLSGNTVSATSSTGTCTITATKSADSTYSSITATVNITVNDRASISEAVNSSVTGTVLAQATAAQRFAESQIKNVTDHIQDLRRHFNVKNNQIALNINSPQLNELKQVYQQFSNAVRQAPIQVAQNNLPVDGSATKTDASGDYIKLAQANALPSDISVTNTESHSANLNDRLFGEKQFGIWASGTFDYGSINHNDFRTSGITVGVDYQLNPRVILGAAIGYGWDHTDIDSFGTKVNSDQTTGTIYGLYKAENDWFADVLLGYGDLKLKNRRYSSAADSVLKANRNGDTIFGSVSVGRAFVVNKAVIQPYLRFSQMTSSLNAYDEGTNVNALAYDKATIESRAMSAGLIALYDIALENGKLTPSAKLEVRHNTRGSINQLISYADTPAESTLYSLTPAPSDIQSYGLGLIYQAKNGISSDVNWLGSVGSNSYHSNTIRLNVKLPF